jgi:hypothetical protein
MTVTVSRYSRPQPFSEESSAPRRGLADGATEQAPGSAVSSLALAGTSRRRAVIVAECRRCRPQVHGSASQRAVGWSWWSRMSVRMPAVPCRLSAYSVASTRPVSGVRCPLCDVHGWLSNVRCGRPVSRVSVRAFRRPRPLCLHGDFVERVGAAGSHTVRGARGWPSYRIRERLDRLPEPEWLLVGLSGVASDA